MPADVDLIDAQVHLDLYPDASKFLDDARNNRVRVVAVTNAPSVFFHTLNVSKDHEYVHAAVGLHPELVASHEQELPSFWPHLSATQFVGEVGLDYTTPDEDLRDRQRRVFAAVLSRCADSGGKVLTVHSRRAARDVIAAVGRNYPGTVILHWFSGSLRELEAAIDIGCYFSINPMMITSQSGQKLIKAMPRERVLTERWPVCSSSTATCVSFRCPGSFGGYRFLLGGRSHRCCRDGASKFSRDALLRTLSPANLTDGATIDRRASATTVLRESGPH